MADVVFSEEMRQYFDGLERDARHCYSVAAAAREKGYDPELDVEILQAMDLASRVEALLKDFGVSDIADEIRELSRSHNREEVSLIMAKRVARRKWRSKEEALDRAVRTGLAILTEGILVAPLEGIVSVKIRTTREGNYAEVYYSGPIRSAGGTGQALSVLITDVVRRELGIGKYVATRGEVERLKEEIPLYKNVQHLQYTPTNEEVDLIASNCPVSINGEGTEDVEVTGFKNLRGIVTNRVRGGACLVIAEGLCQKAPKVQNHVRKLGIDGWEFIDKYLKTKKGKATELGPDARFMQDVLAGRPVLSHPSRKGGFRLRYGRSRASGLAALSISPITMYVLDEFIAVGTQIKVERPGKAGAVTPCEALEGPTVLLKNGNLVEVTSIEDAKNLRGDIAGIIDLGEILISFGEFLENNHTLMPGGYALEWYREELRRKAKELPADWENPGPARAFELSKEYGVPLHPRYNLFWHDVSIDDVQRMRGWIAEHGAWVGDRLVIEQTSDVKNILVELGALHGSEDGKVAVDERYSYPLLRGLGLSTENGQIIMNVIEGVERCADALSLASFYSGIAIRARAPTRIGARMGRPEKAKERLLTPPPHVLFPVGRESGPQRLLSKAVEVGKLNIEAGLRKCASCRRTGFQSRCSCGGHTVHLDKVTRQSVDMQTLYSASSRILNGSRIPEVKGVQGMTSRLKTPEPLEKGFLRARHDVHVFKDGTIRFDMTNVPLTHFRPSEMGQSVETLKRLGYSKDHQGKPLDDPEQLLELKVQDIIVSESCGSYLVRVAGFVDDMLVRLYGLEAFYNAKEPGDLAGHLVIGLSPHTSGGILGRLIGYSKASVCYAHPYFHAAKRRNCDGDEDCVMLLMDGLVDFSRTFLPESRGSLMDCPLVLTTRLDPAEIDKEAHNVDLSVSYPLEFYEAAQNKREPKEVDHLIDLVGKRIGTVLQYENFGFSMGSCDVSSGPKSSAYKEGSMEEKLNAQLELAVKIRAVDANDVATKIISGHFLPDLMGNLRAFSSQQFRCTKCNEKYRRLPLQQTCPNCGGNLTLTVYEKSVKKYLEITKRLLEEYEISSYVAQRIALMDGAINSLFNGKKDDGKKLEDYF